MKKLNTQNMNSQQGFTLIELVVVIVILGILAATAAPKFIDLQDDAKTATLQAVKASMQSAATLVYSKSLIAGNNDAALADGELVVVNGDDVAVNFGYPVADYTTPAGSWDLLLDLDPDAFLTVVVGTSYIVYTKGATEPTAIDDACTAVYTQSTAINLAPTFVVNECE